MAAWSILDTAHEQNKKLFGTSEDGKDDWPMIYPGQFTVIAQDPSGNYGWMDVLDLEETSFRAWVLGKMVKLGIVTGPPQPSEGEIVLAKCKSTIPENARTDKWGSPLSRKKQARTEVEAEREKYDETLF